MLRTDHRIWLFSYPLSFGNDSEKRIPVGRLHVRDDEPATSRRTVLESRSGSLFENADNPSGKASRNAKRRSVQTTRPSLWFEYDDAWLSEGFALSHDLPLKNGPILPTKGKRLFSFLEDVRLDPEIRFLMEEAKDKGVSLDWTLDVKPEEAAFTFLLEENSSLGALSVTLEGDVKPLAPSFLARRLSLRPALPVFQSRGDELLYAHHAAERNRARKAELELLLSARTLPGRTPVYSVLVDKRPVVATFGLSSEPVHAALWQGFSLEIARSVGIRTVTPTLRMLMGEPVLLRTRADRDAGNRPLASLSAKALIAPKGTGLRRTITYSDIVDFLTREGAAPKEDLPEVWRRMAFTLLTGPTGDHPGRWLFVRPVGVHSDGWRLAPAHSLTFTSPSLSARGGMKLRAGSARFTTDEAITYAPYFDLSIQEAKRFVLTVRRRLLDWDADAREYGIPPREIEAMADAFED